MQRFIASRRSDSYEGLKMKGQGGCPRARRICAHHIYGAARFLALHGRRRRFLTAASCPHATHMSRISSNREDGLRQDQRYAVPCRCQGRARPGSQHENIRSSFARLIPTTSFRWTSVIRLAGSADREATASAGIERENQAVHGGGKSLRTAMRFSIR